MSASEMTVMEKGIASPCQKSEEPSQVKILRYDAKCPLCCDLASLAVKRSDGLLKISPLLDQAESIEFYDGAQWHKGSEAWRQLLLYLPDLKSLGWIARKLKLEQSVAKGLASLASGLKWFCKNCGRRV